MPDPDVLTPRERAVLRALAEGQTMKGTAHQLGTTLQAIRYTALQARRRLGAETTAQACCILARAEAGPPEH
jgi:DNA-binding NarL/FixJ family response regulator